MARLYTYKVGDVITEFYGPVTGRNYNMSGLVAPAAPALEVQIIGNGAVQVYQNNTSTYQAPNQPNPVMFDNNADPSSWATLGAVITSASGKVTLAPTVDPKFSAIRVVLTALGDGHLIVNPIWN